MRGVMNRTDDAFINAYITQIAPKVASHVARIYIKDNQHVNAGQLLLELDSRDFEARLSAARAALQEAEARHRATEATVEQTRITARGSVAEASSGVTAARAELEMVRAQVRAASDRERQAQATINAAQAQLVATEAEAKRADADVRRYQRLYDGGLVSQQQLDQATAATQTANARLAAARAQVDVASAAAATASAEVVASTTQAHQAEAQVSQARGRLTGTTAWRQQVNVGQEQASSASESVEQARANVRMAELQLSYTRICAPVSGRVTRKSVEVGDHVQVSQALMAIVPKHPNRLEPGKVPLHTLIAPPASRKKSSGRRSAAWAPTAAADSPPDLHRHDRFGQDIQHALAGPRWLSGRLRSASRATRCTSRRASARDDRRARAPRASGGPLG